MSDIFDKVRKSLKELAMAGSFSERHLWENSGEVDLGSDDSIRQHGILSVVRSMATYDDPMDCDVSIQGVIERLSLHEGDDPITVDEVRDFLDGMDPQEKLLWITNGLCEGPTY